MTIGEVTEPGYYWLYDRNTGDAAPIEFYEWKENYGRKTFVYMVIGYDAYEYLNEHEMEFYRIEKAVQPKWEES